MPNPIAFHSKQLARESALWLRWHPKMPEVCQKWAVCDRAVSAVVVERFVQQRVALLRLVMSLPESQNQLPLASLPESQNQLPLASLPESQNRLLLASLPESQQGWILRHDSLTPFQVSLSWSPKRMQTQFWQEMPPEGKSP